MNVSITACCRHCSHAFIQRHDLLLDLPGCKVAGKDHNLSNERIGHGAVSSQLDLIERETEATTTGDSSTTTTTGDSSTTTTAGDSSTTTTTGDSSTTTPVPFSFAGGDPHFMTWYAWLFPVLCGCVCARSCDPVLLLVA